MSAAAGRQLFIYWKTSAADAAAACAAAASMQAGLQREHPSLQTGLYRRADTGASEATLMEVYTCPDGVDDALQASVERAAAQHLSKHLNGARHVEVFNAV